MRRSWIPAAMAVLLMGCASSSENIAPSYVSPILYQSYSCQQLAEEAQRISTAAAGAAGVQDEKASKDAVATGVALVLFWPAAFLVSGGDGQNAAQLAQLRGQMGAIEQANIQKKCGLVFQKPERLVSKKSSPRCNPHNTDGYGCVQ